MNRGDMTCVSLLTPSGRGAVAVVAVAGPAAVASVDRYFRAANGLSLGEQAIGRIVYGHWSGPDMENTSGEDLLVCRRSDDGLEVHCHGGRQSSAQIVADLAVEGCTVTAADEWLDRHHDCPLTASAHRALAQAKTFRTAQILLDQYHGALRHEVVAIHRELSAGKLADASERMRRLLQYPQLSRHLTEPWRVVIAGHPNVGKSSLINALVGYERAIVFDQPGTTRDIVSTTTAIEGWPVELSDTAGLHQTSPSSEIDAIETAGMTLARQRLLNADLVVWVLDAVATSSAGALPLSEIGVRGDERQLSASPADVSSPNSNCCPSTPDFANWELARQQAQAVGVQLRAEQTLIAVNKIDLAPFPNDQHPKIIGTCAINGGGTQRLLAAIVARLVPLVPAPRAAVPFTVEQVADLRAALDALGTGDAGTARTIVRPWLGGS